MDDAREVKLEGGFKNALCGKNEALIRVSAATQLIENPIVTCHVLQGTIAGKVCLSDSSRSCSSLLSFSPGREKALFPLRLV